MEKLFLSNIIEIMVDSVIVVNESQIITYLNQAAQTTFGYTAKELLGKPLDLLVPTDKIKSHRTHIQNFHASPVFSKSMAHRRDIAGRRKDGTIFPARASISKVTNDEGIFFNVVLRDITEEKRVETQIEDQMKQLAALRKIDIAIANNSDLNSILDVVLDQTITHLKIDAANILLFNQYTQRLEFAAGQGFKTDALAHTRLRLGEGYAGLAALERRTITITDLGKRQTDFLRSPNFSAEKFITYAAVPLLAKGMVKGVLEVYSRTIIDPRVEWTNFFETLAGQTAIALDHFQLFMELQRSHSELFFAYDETIEGWSRALDLRDKETEGHTQRVTIMTEQLARELGIPEAEIVHIRRGCLLHDIGKMGIPDNILLKPDKLTDEEWTIMRRHPRLAYDMLAPISYLRLALDIPYCHHEKWDGTGYPRGLSGEEIPLAARIFAIVDVYDALSSDRPYRPAWPMEKIIAYIQSNRGSHFDPKVVDAFLDMILFDKFAL